MNDANQLLSNISSCQSQTSSTVVSTHCSLTSSYQGHDEVREEIYEAKIGDNQQRQEEGKEDASSHNCNVGSTNVTVVSSRKKLKHCSSSSTLVSSLVPRSSSTITTTSMFQHRPHSRRDTYRTLQLPINSTNKLSITTSNHQQRPIKIATTGSENNLRINGTCIHDRIHNYYNNGNNCFDDESIRTLSRGKLIFINI